jgi:glycosyltransferase involved in cell wall biosynthesis
MTEGIETVELDCTLGIAWIKNWQPDVISAHDAATWVLDASSEMAIPYVDTLHGLLPLLERSSANEIARGKRIAKVIAVSELERERYLTVNPTFPSDRIVVIPNGVNDWQRTPRERSAARDRWGVTEEYVFLSLARHCMQKNSFGLISAFDEVVAQYPNAHLVIAGRRDDSAYFAQVERLRASLKCQERVHLRDHYADPSELLTLADGFVLDSFFEGWSLASMEALYAGVPVVLSDVGGAREQVGAGGFRGHLVANPLGDPINIDRDKLWRARFSRQVNREALVDAMSSLVSNRDYYFFNRERLKEESAMRFAPDVCLRSHALVLTNAAERGVVSETA